MDGIGVTSAGSRQNAQLNTALKNAPQPPIQQAGAQHGVYLPYSVTGSPAVKTFTGGGIFVEGGGDGQALSRLEQHGAGLHDRAGQRHDHNHDRSGGRFSRHDDDRHERRFRSGYAGINGVPQQFSSASVSQGPATMLYVDGAITSFRARAKASRHSTTGPL